MVIQPSTDIVNQTATIQRLTRELEEVKAKRDEYFTYAGVKDYGEALNQRDSANYHLQLAEKTIQRLTRELAELKSVTYYAYCGQRQMKRLRGFIGARWHDYHQAFHELTRYEDCRRDTCADFANALAEPQGTASAPERAEE